MAKEIIDYLQAQMLKDKAEYKGKEWSDHSWTVSEIMQFISCEAFTSYTIMKFGKRYTHDELDTILKTNFKSEYDKAVELLNEFL